MEHTVPSARTRRSRPHLFTLGARKLLDVARAAPAVDDAVLARFEYALEATVSSLLVSFEGSPICEQVRWHFGIGGEAVQRRGKRLRPRLLLQIALNEGGTFEGALDAALAVEVLHNYSLVHDDIEDGDEMRHGRPTVWARYGMSHGVNAGDSMCAISYLTLMRNAGGLPPERVAACVRLLHNANLGMCSGQGYDIGFESAPHVSMDAYLTMIEGKTAVLFGAACELGAVAAGAAGQRAAAYGALGRAYGRAFQIRDDVRGTWGTREETGKPRASDIVRRKWTFPIVWALNGPPSDARDAIAARYAVTTPLDSADIETIAAALDALGARRAAEEACREYVSQAERTAEQFRLDRHGSVRGLFEDGGATTAALSGFG